MRALPWQDGDLEVLQEVAALENKLMDNSESSSFTAEMIRDALTAEGRHPIELCFVLGKGIRCWNPRGMFQGFMIDNAPLADACRAYLRSQNRYFATPDELEAWAKAHNWPNLEELLPQIEVMRQRKRSQAQPPIPAPS